MVRGEIYIVLDGTASMAPYFDSIISVLTKTLTLLNLLKVKINVIIYGDYFKPNQPMHEVVRLISGDTDTVIKGLKDFFIGSLGRGNDDGGEAVVSAMVYLLDILKYNKSKDNMFIFISDDLPHFLDSYDKRDKYPNFRYKREHQDIERNVIKRIYSEKYLDPEFLVKEISKHGVTSGFWVVQGAREQYYKTFYDNFSTDYKIIPEDLQKYILSFINDCTGSPTFDAYHAKPRVRDIENYFAADLHIFETPSTQEEKDNYFMNFCTFVETYPNLIPYIGFFYNIFHKIIKTVKAVPEPYNYFSDVIKRVRSVVRRYGLLLDELKTAKYDSLNLNELSFRFPMSELSYVYTGDKSLLMSTKEFLDGISDRRNHIIQKIIGLLKNIQLVKGNIGIPKEYVDDNYNALFSLILTKAVIIPPNDFSFTLVKLSNNPVFDDIKTPDDYLKWNDEGDIPDTEYNPTSLYMYSKIVEQTPKSVVHKLLRIYELSKQFQNSEVLLCKYESQITVDNIDDKTLKSIEIIPCMYDVVRDLWYPITLFKKVTPEEFKGYAGRDHTREEELYLSIYTINKYSTKEIFDRYNNRTEFVDDPYYNTSFVYSDGAEPFTVQYLKKKEDGPSCMKCARCNSLYFVHDTGSVSAFKEGSLCFDCRAAYNCVCGCSTLSQYNAKELKAIITNFTEEIDVENITSRDMKVIISENSIPVICKKCDKLHTPKRSETVSCTGCGSKYKSCSSLYINECPVCNSPPSIIEVSLSKKDIILQNIEKFSFYYGIDRTILENIAKGINFKIKPKIKNCMNEFRDWKYLPNASEIELKYNGFPLINNEEALKFVIDNLFTTCGICFDEFNYSDTKSICGVCTSRFCEECYKSTISESSIQKGKIVPLMCVICPYCRSIADTIPRMQASQDTEEVCQG